MKHKHCFILFLVACGFLKTNAQDFTNNFKINALSPFYNALNVSYEKLLKNKSSSIQIGANYMDFNGKLFSLDYDYEKEKVTGFVLTLEYRTMFDKSGFNNFYLAPFVRGMYYKRDAIYYDYNSNLTSLTGSYIHEKSEYVSLGLGAVVGKQFVFKERFSVDLFLGPVMQFLVSENRNAFNLTSKQYEPYVQENTLLSERIPNKYINGYGLRAGVNIGILF